MKNNKLKIKKIFVFSVLIIVFVFSIASVSAQNLQGLDETAKGIGYRSPSTEETTKIQISTYVGTIIAAVLGFIGVIFMVLILMGAFAILGAGGNEEHVIEGKKKIKNGAIGMAIVFAAYISAKVLLEWIASWAFKV